MFSGKQLHTNKEEINTHVKVKPRILCCKNNKRVPSTKAIIF